ncbi:MAG: hypothetical protein KGO96_03550 [Elusimicrobia bacterium]|nr:hypothetical protein [Elusimicrobiota bacterium]MDE2238054.1 hypothetical protein [Elusimicrobiota bacterium]MDE2424968.1 hypothetical protein [Elusimicrobiota bacterium]
MKLRLPVVFAAALFCAGALSAAAAPIVDSSRPQATDTSSLIARLRKIIAEAQPRQSQPAGKPARSSVRHDGSCGLIGIEGGACVYRCADASERRYPPVMEGLPAHPACPQLVFPF